MMLRKQFTAFCKAQGYKQTRQRDLVLETLLRLPGHTTADELADRVKDRDPAIGRATVYRTLKLLEEAGLVSPLHVDGGAVRYEPAPLSRHDHIVCEACGKVVEVQDEKVEALRRHMVEREGFELTRGACFYGLCAACRGKA